MNKARKKKITASIKEIEEIKEAAESVYSDIEDILQEEGEYLDNIPENLAGSERAQESEQAVDALSDAMDSLVEAIDGLDSAMSELAETGADPGTVKKGEKGSTKEDEDVEAPAVLITVHAWKGTLKPNIKADDFPSRDEAYAAMKAALKEQVAKESKTAQETDGYMRAMESGIEYSNMRLSEDSAIIYTDCASSMWKWQIHEVKEKEGD